MTQKNSINKAQIRLRLFNESKVSFEQKTRVNTQ
jgi:hypothetical protein